MKKRLHRFEKKSLRGSQKLLVCLLAALLLLPGSLFSALGADSAPAGTFSGVSSPGGAGSRPDRQPGGRPAAHPLP